MKLFFSRGGLLLLALVGNASAYLYDGPDFDTYRKVARVQAIPKIFGATHRAIPSCAAEAATVPRAAPPYLADLMTTAAPRIEGLMKDPLTSAFQEGIAEHLDAILTRRQNRKRRLAESEVPTARPEMNPDKNDHSGNQDDFSTLAALRQLAHTLSCATNYDPEENDGLAADIRSSTNSFGKCMCDGANYGVKNNDKLWQMCVLSDIMQQRLGCKASSSREMCDGYTAPTATSMIFTHDHCSTMTTPAFAVPLLEFDNQHISDDGVMKRTLILANIETTEGISYYFLAKALAASHAIAHGEICGHVLTAPEQLIPGWDTVLSVELLEEGDHLMASAATTATPFATLLRKDADYIVLLRHALTEFEYRLHFTHSSVGQVVDGNDGDTLKDMHGVHMGFAAAAAAIAPALEARLALDAPRVSPRTTGRLIFAGQGLGAGVAQVLALQAARHWAGDTLAVSAVLFGAPPALNSTYIPEFDSKVNVRQIAADFDFWPYSPCAEGDSIVGQHLCPNGAVPQSIEHGMFSYYNKVGGRIEFSHLDVHETSGDGFGSADDRWINDEFLNITISALPTISIDTAFFKSANAQFGAFGHCAYTCWSSSHCSPLVNAAGLYCRDCPYFNHVLPS